jgi:hypothetical protein
MSPGTRSVKNQWAEDWLSSVANGSIKMSQRTLVSVRKRGGSLETIKALAERKKVHLLLVKDDKENKLAAASLERFEVIC